MENESPRGLRNTRIILIAAGAATVAWVALVGLPAALVAGESHGEGELAPAAEQTEQVAAGAGVFEQNCARCHGDRGQGGGPDGDGPALIGHGSALADYRTAKRLFDLVSNEMPQDDPGSLSQQTYYDAVAFLLSQNGWNPDGQPVIESTVEGIPLSR